MIFQKRYSFKHPRIKHWNHFSLSPNQIKIMLFMEYSLINTTYSLQANVVLQKFTFSNIIKIHKITLSRVFLNLESSVNELWRSLTTTEVFVMVSLCQINQNLSEKVSNKLFFAVYLQLHWTFLPISYFKHIKLSYFNWNWSIFLNFKPDRTENMLKCPPVYRLRLRLFQTKPSLKHI